MIRTVTATEYVTPLREGGSLPAIVEADDDGTYVVKFRGAGQGPRALVAELISGEVARLLGLRVPEIVFIQLDPRLAKTEPDAEIQELLRKSEGLNLALDYLPSSIGFDPLADKPIAGKSRLASEIAWFDALVTNVDRTARNTNLLVWHRELWLIDHGASLYFHHSWGDYLERAAAPFTPIRDHVLLPWATEIEEVDSDFAKKISIHAIREVLAMIPDEWLGDVAQFANVALHRSAYEKWFEKRLTEPRVWAEEAARARTLLV